MTPELMLNLRQCACRRAHLAGAEAARLEAEAKEAQRRAVAARCLYFRELATVDRVGGHPTPFDALDGC
jgi:hypothetical protein